MKFRKKPVVIEVIEGSIIFETLTGSLEATQWFKNGDHPEDGTERFTSGALKGELFEGKVVRYFRHPDIPGVQVCSKCNRVMHQHGWIDTLGDGHNVCPGDWIITGIKGEMYPCKPDIFAATYEKVEP